MGSDLGGTEEEYEEKFLKECEDIFPKDPKTSQPHVTDDVVRNLLKLWSDFQEKFQAKHFTDVDKCLASLLLCSAKIVIKFSYSRNVNPELKRLLKDNIENYGNLCNNSSHKSFCTAFASIVANPWNSTEFINVTGGTNTNTIEQVTSEVYNKLSNTEGWIILEARLDEYTNGKKKDYIGHFGLVLHTLVRKGLEFYPNGSNDEVVGPYDPYKFSYSKFLEYLEVYALLVFKENIKKENIFPEQKSGQSEQKCWSGNTIIDVIDGLKTKPEKPRLFPKFWYWKNVKDLERCAIFLAKTATQKASKSSNPPALEKLFIKWTELVGVDQDEKQPYDEIVERSWEISSCNLYRIANATLRDSERSQFPEIFICAMVKDVNAIESLKSTGHNNLEDIRKVEKQFSPRYLDLANYFRDYQQTCKMCVLTAFSLNPGEQLFHLLFPETNCTSEDAPGVCRKDDPDFWTEEFISLRHIDFTKVDLKVDEDIPLTENLKIDLNCVLEHPRYKGFSNWTSSNEDLKQLCLNILQQKSLDMIDNKPLDYVNVDYDKYKNFKPQYDPEDDGIEKGYRAHERRGRKRIFPPKSKPLPKRKKLTEKIQTVRKKAINRARLPQKDHAEGQFNPSKHSIANRFKTSHVARRGRPRKLVDERKHQPIVKIRSIDVEGKRMPNICLTRNPWFPGRGGSMSYGYGELFSKLVRPAEQPARLGTTGFLNAERETAFLVRCETTLIENMEFKDTSVPSNDIANTFQEMWYGESEGDGFPKDEKNKLIINKVIQQSYFIKLHLEPKPGSRQGVVIPASARNVKPKKRKLNGDLREGKKMKMQKNGLVKPTPPDTMANGEQAESVIALDSTEESVTTDDRGEDLKDTVMTEPSSLHVAETEPTETEAPPPAVLSDSPKVEMPRLTESIGPFEIFKFPIEKESPKNMPEKDTLKKSNTMGDDLSSRTNMGSNLSIVPKIMTSLESKDLSHQPIANVNNKPRTYASSTKKRKIAIVLSSTYRAECNSNTTTDVSKSPLAIIFPQYKAPTQSGFIVPNTSASASASSTQPSPSHPAALSISPGNTKSNTNVASTTASAENCSNMDSELQPKSVVLEPSGSNNSFSNTLKNNHEVRNVCVHQGLTPIVEGAKSTKLEANEEVRTVNITASGLDLEFGARGRQVERHSQPPISNSIFSLPEIKFVAGPKGQEQRQQLENRIAAKDFETGSGNLSSLSDTTINLKAPTNEKSLCDYSVSKTGELSKDPPTASTSKMPFFGGIRQTSNVSTNTPTKVHPTGMTLTKEACFRGADDTDPPQTAFVSTSLPQLNCKPNSTTQHNNEFPNVITGELQNRAVMAPSSTNSYLVNLDTRRAEVSILTSRIFKKDVKTSPGTNLFGLIDKDLNPLAKQNSATASRKSANSNVDNAKSNSSTDGNGTLPPSGIGRTTLLEHSKDESPQYCDRLVSGECVNQSQSSADIRGNGVGGVEDNGLLDAETKTKNVTSTLSIATTNSESLSLKEILPLGENNELLTSINESLSEPPSAAEVETLEENKESIESGSFLPKANQLLGIPFNGTSCDSNDKSATISTIDARREIVPVVVSLETFNPTVDIQPELAKTDHSSPMNEKDFVEKQDERIVLMKSVDLPVIDLPNVPNPSSDVNADNPKDANVSTPTSPKIQTVEMEETEQTVNQQSVTASTENDQAQLAAELHTKDSTVPNSENVTDFHPVGETESSKATEVGPLQDEVPEVVENESSQSNEVRNHVGDDNLQLQMQNPKSSELQNATENVTGESDSPKQPIPAHEALSKCKDIDIHNSHPFVTESGNTIPLVKLSDSDTEPEVEPNSNTPETPISICAVKRKNTGDDRGNRNRDVKSDCVRPERPSTPVSKVEELIMNIINRKAKRPYDEEEKIKISPSVVEHVHRHNHRLSSVVLVRVFLRRLTSAELPVSARSLKLVKRSSRLKQKKTRAVEVIMKSVLQNSNSHVGCDDDITSTSSRNTSRASSPNIEINDAVIRNKNRRIPQNPNASLEATSNKSPETEINRLQNSPSVGIAKKRIKISAERNYSLGASVLNTKSLPSTEKNINAQNIEVNGDVEKITCPTVETCLQSVELAAVSEHSLNYVNSEDDYCDKEVGSLMECDSAELLDTKKNSMQTNDDRQEIPPLPELIISSIASPEEFIVDDEEKDPLALDSFSEEMPASPISSPLFEPGQEVVLSHTLEGDTEVTPEEEETNSVDSGAGESSLTLITAEITPVEPLQVDNSGECGDADNFITPDIFQEDGEINDDDNPTMRCNTEPESTIDTDMDIEENNSVCTYFDPGSPSEDESPEAEPLTDADGNSDLPSALEFHSVSCENQFPSQQYENFAETMEVEETEEHDFPNEVSTFEEEELRTAEAERHEDELNRSPELTNSIEVIEPEIEEFQESTCREESPRLVKLPQEVSYHTEDAKEEEVNAILVSEDFTTQEVEENEVHTVDVTEEVELDQGNVAAAEMLQVEGVIEEDVQNENMADEEATVDQGKPLEMEMMNCAMAVLKERSCDANIEENEPQEEATQQETEEVSVVSDGYIYNQKDNGEESPCLESDAGPLDECPVDSPSECNEQIESIIVATESASEVPDHGMEVESLPENIETDENITLMEEDGPPCLAPMSNIVECECEYLSDDEAPQIDLMVIPLIPESCEP